MSFRDKIREFLHKDSNYFPDSIFGRKFEPNGMNDYYIIRTYKADSQVFAHYEEHHLLNFAGSPWNNKPHTYTLSLSLSLSFFLSWMLRCFCKMNAIMNT